MDFTPAEDPETRQTLDAMETAVNGDREWIALYPHGEAAAPGLPEALAAVGLPIRIVASLAALEAPRKPAAIVINVAGLGSPDEWAGKLRDLLGRLASLPGRVPVVLIDPPMEQWGVNVGWAAGYEARITWPGPADAGTLLRAVLAGDGEDR